MPGTRAVCACHSSYPRGPGDANCWYLLLLHRSVQALKCRLSPDMSCLATASSDSTVKLWNVSDFLSAHTPVQPTTILQGHQRWVWDCVFSLDSAYLVSASSDHTARLWDLSTGESIREYTGHTKAVCCVALSDRENSV